MTVVLFQGGWCLLGLHLQLTQTKWESSYDVISLPVETGQEGFVPASSRACVFSSLPGLRRSNMGNPKTTSVVGTTNTFDLPSQDRSWDGRSGPTHGWIEALWECQPGKPA